MPDDPITWRIDMESMDTPTGATARTRIVRRDADPTTTTVVCAVLNTTADAVTVIALGPKGPSS